MGYMTENEMYQGRGAYATNTVSGVQKLQNELKNKGFLTNIDSPGVFSQSTVDALGKYLSAPQPSLGSVSGAMNSLQNAQNALTTPSLPSLTNAGSTTPTLPSSGATTGSTTPSLTPTGMPTLPSVNGASTTTTPTTGGAISTTGTPSTGATSMTPAGQGTGAPTIGLPTIPQINTGATTPTTSTTPAVPTAAGPSALEKQYQGLITPAQGEVDTQSMINNLLASKQMGLNSIADQAIPMNFITGQQSSVERRAQGQLIPLQQKMALLQAQRQSALEATKFALDREDKAKEISGETPDIKEYNFAKSQGYTGSFTDYQTNQANLKATVNGLTPYQSTNVFNNIATKYNTNPFVQADQSSPIIQSAIDAIKANPNSGSAQLRLLYGFIKNLDPNSAVREGETALATSLVSYTGLLENALARIQAGQIVDASTALELARGAEELQRAVHAAAVKAYNNYQAQAQVAGVGDMFKSYGGMQSDSSGTPGTTAGDYPWETM